jgi:uncharacterized protein (DUF58 family)
MPEIQNCDTLSERQFVLAVKRLADSLSYGSDTSPFLGSGIDYVQSRAYQAGDPVKSIDWRITARTGRVHVKEYEAPKRIPVYLIIDTSASMTGKSGPLSKYAWAVQIAGGIALAALHRISPVGVLGCGDRDINVSPSLSRVRVLLWLHQLRHYRTDESTRLGETLRKLGAILTHRAVIIALSDFHDPDGLAALKLLAQKHDCVALHFQDPAERGALRGGIFRGAEAESGAAFTARGRDEWFDWNAVASEFQTSGIDHLILATDQPFLPRLRWFLARRGLLGKGSR